MKKHYMSALKTIFHKHLLVSRKKMNLSQLEMSEKLLVDIRSYVDIEHGKTLCNTLSFVYFLLYICPDPMGFLEEIRTAFGEVDES